METNKTSEDKHPRMVELIISDDCMGCGACMVHCPRNAITSDGNKMKVDMDICELCLECTSICPIHAITIKRKKHE